MQCAVYIQHDLSIKQQQTEKNMEKMYKEKTQTQANLFNKNSIQLRTLLFV